MAIAKAGFAQTANRSQMVVGRAGRLSNINLMQFDYKTKQISYSLLLLCLVFICGISAQTSDSRKEVGQAQLEFDDGNYSKAIELAKAAVESARETKAHPVIFQGLNIIASSQISLHERNEAEASPDKTLDDLSEIAVTRDEKAWVFLRFAWFSRSQHKFGEALDYSKKAVSLAPANRHILAEHYLNLGRIFFASGYDISAIIWLEKAESLLERENVSPAKLDTYRFLTLAWWAKLNYQKALKYSKKTTSAAEKTNLSYKYRQSLFDSATILSETGQIAAAFKTLEIGLNLALAKDNSYQARIFLTSLLLNSLDVGNVSKASVYLGQLEKSDQNKSFTFEILLGKAIIAAFSNEHETFEKLFAELETRENSSEYILPGWRLKVAQRNGDWSQLITLNQKYLDLTLKDNFRDELPSIEFNFAEAYFHLNQFPSSIDHLEKSLALIEEIQQSGDNHLSLGILETYHSAYRLLTQIEIEKEPEAFELADFLKARLLKDKINNAATRAQFEISPVVRRTLEDLSLKYIDDQKLVTEIEKNEKLATNTIREVNLAKPDLSALARIPDLNDTAIVSYFFTLDKRLLAFVWERNKPLKSIYLPVSEDEIESDAENTHLKIKNLIFFKRDGKALFDKLLKPLSMSAKHLVIIPDKSLWKIPFQALSPDGEKYLIEDKVVSYAPSVSILLEQLKARKPVRRTLEAFANSSYNNQVLKYVNTEATNVASLFNSRPMLNASVTDFRRFADKADILHFSMHAQVDNDQPLESFLGFKGTGKDRGRLTVENLLNTKLKKGSLVFLASCDTNNVLSGEGLVSLSWGMMGSGASTVISAQWEANDKLTGIFTEAFYRSYKQGYSSAEALQKASLEMIKNKSTSMHEPYYWADFTLNGDFR